MNDEAPKNKRQDYEIPCTLLAVTELDMSQSIPPEELAAIPAGGLLRDEVVLEPSEIDFSSAASANGQRPRSEGPVPQIDNAETDEEKLGKVILGLAQVCVAARVNNTPLPPDAAKALAQLVRASPPLNAAGNFLEAVAAGQPLPPVSPDLPSVLAQILQALAGSLSD
jgi:hypothetical protein